MRFLKLLLAALCMAPAFVHANELLRVFDLATQNDATFRAANYELEAARQNKPIAFGALLPQISAGANYAEDRFTFHDFHSNTAGVSDADACTFTGGTFKPDGSFTGLPHHDDCTINAQPWALSLSLTQTVFDWGAFSRYSQSEDIVAAAEAKYRAAQQDVALRTATAYFNVLSAADGVRVANAAQQAFERQLDLAKKRFEVGLAAKTDQEEAQARYDQAAADMIAAELALSNAKEALAVITAAPDVRVELLRDEIPLIGPVPDNLAEWMKSTENGNFDVIGAHLAVEVAKKDVSISQSKHYPTLSLNGSGSESKSAGFNQGKFADDRATLQLNVPIFAGFATQAAVNQSQSTESQREAQFELARRTAQQSTRTAYQSVISGVARVKALKQAVISNQTAMEASQVGLEVGTRTNVDVLNAQQLLFTAERDYSKARYDYLLAILQLKASSGQLAGKDLAEIDQLLETAPPTPAAAPATAPAPTPAK